VLFVPFLVQPKLSGLDTVHLTCLLSSWSTLKFEPEPAVMRCVMGEVYTKLPLFDDKVSVGSGLFRRVEAG
jgi:hypothetical protein